VKEKNSLKDYKLGYDLVMKENEEIKEMNNYLSNDNMLFAQDVYILKSNLEKLNQEGNDNDKIKAELNKLKKDLNILKNKKQINNVFEYISQLKNKNKHLEEQLLNKENKSIYNNNKNKNEINGKIKINLYPRNKDNKYILANKFYSDILLRILKYHIKNDQNVKNILFKLLDLNHNKINLITDIENLMTNNKIKDINKKKNDINKKKKELENLQNNIDYIDKELKKYEK